MNSAIVVTTNVQSVWVASFMDSPKCRRMI
jgi:hypothetical protein